MEIRGESRMEAIESLRRKIHNLSACLCANGCVLGGERRCRPVKDPDNCEKRLAGYRQLLRDYQDSVESAADSLLVNGQASTAACHNVERASEGLDYWKPGKR